MKPIYSQSELWLCLYQAKIKDVFPFLFFQHVFGCILTLRVHEGSIQRSGADAHVEEDVGGSSGGSGSQVQCFRTHLQPGEVRYVLDELLLQRGVCECVKSQTYLTVHCYTG